MIIYTAQIAKWRLVEKLGLKIFDTTVKSGWKTFAPTWDILMEYKNSEQTDKDWERYTEKYLKKIEDSLKTHGSDWRALLKKEVVVLGCYCSNPARCHRTLLANFIKDYLDNINQPVTLMGDITNETLKTKQE